MWVECSQCIWYDSCKKEKRTEDRDNILMCPYYDGLLVLDSKNSEPCREKSDYYEEELGYDDYEVYIEEIGWVKVNPDTIMVK